MLHECSPGGPWIEDAFGDPTPTEHEHRIYGDDNASIYAIVDEVDYAWALQWAWSPKYSRGGRKVYLRRVSHERIGDTHRDRVQRTVWLHVEILRRTGAIPPSLFHTIADHFPHSDGLNCRRSNLRWATPSMNRKNCAG